jgi:hypothetical protein
MSAQEMKVVLGCAFKAERADRPLYAAAVHHHRARGDPAGVLAQEGEAALGRDCENQRFTGRKVGKVQPAFDHACG